MTTVRLAGVNEILSCKSQSQNMNATELDSWRMSCLGYLSNTTELDSWWMSCLGYLSNHWNNWTGKQKPKILSVVVLVLAAAAAMFVLSKLLLKVKVRTLDIVPLRSESPPQKRSGMARVLKGLTVLPAHPHVHLQSE